MPKQQQLIVVSFCDNKNSRSAFEKAQKSIYCNGNISISFMHKEALPQDVAHKAKEKHTSAVIFDAGVPVKDVIAITHAVRRKLNGNTPMFYHIAIRSIIEGVKTAVDHESIYKEIVVSV